MCVFIGHWRIASAFIACGAIAMFAHVISQIVDVMMGIVVAFAAKHHDLGVWLLFMFHFMQMCCFFPLFPHWVFFNVLVLALFVHVGVYGFF